MRTGTSAGVYFTMPDENVWIQEKQIITLERQSGTVVAVSLYVRNNLTTPIATYKLDSAGKCQVDISDLVRIYAKPVGTTPADTLYIGMDMLDANGTALGIMRGFHFYSQGLISPASVFRPESGMPMSYIVPPERLIYCGKSDLICETLLDFKNDWVLSGGAIWADNTTRKQIQAIGDFSLTFSISTRQYRVDNVYAQKTPCGGDFVCVRWVSFTGVQRVHHFELRKYTIEAADSYELLTLDNSYLEVKGRRDGFTAYIDGLNQYDYWYYADMLTSSKVEISLDGVNWYRVKVSNKSATLPSGGEKNGKLEIAINWRKYDAVTM